MSLHTAIEEIIGRLREADAAGIAAGAGLALVEGTARCSAVAWCRRVRLGEMTAIVPAPADLRPGAAWVRPGHGLGVIGDPSSRWGRVWGHNGGGPGYRTSALHAPDLGPLSVCAMCASEEDTIAERIVFAVLDAARDHRPRR